jgi:hypothetical protein
MRCAECKQRICKQPIHLEQGDEKTSFCSHECVIAYSVRRIQQRIAHQNRRVRFMARQNRWPRPPSAHNHDRRA